MNYYNPYFGASPYTPTLGNIAGGTSSGGLLKRIFGGGKISSFINGTQKTLNIINQAIPIVKQVSPVMKNAKTMFKVMNEFKRVDAPSSKSSNNINSNVSNNVNNTKIESIEEISNITSNNNGPTFFL